jgi:TQXA domain-containing protein
MRNLLRTIAAVGGLVALLSGVLALTATGAQAASVLTFSGLGEFATVNGTYLDKQGVAHEVSVSAGEMLATVDGVPTMGYCIDFANGIGAGDQLPEADWQDMPVAPGRINSIAWILNHYYPKDDPAFPLQGTTAQKAASVQAAIWHYSDGFDLGGGNDPVIAANYAAILDAVPLNPALGQPITALALQTPDEDRIVGDIVPVTVRTTAVGPIVNVVVTGGERVDAGGAPASGPVSDGDVIYVRRNETGRVQVAVDARAQVQTGRIFMAPAAEEKQAQILARTVTVNATAAIGIDVQPGASIRVVKTSSGGSPDTSFTFSVGAPGVQEPTSQALTYEGTLDWATGIRPGVSYEVRELDLPAGWRRELRGCEGAKATRLDGDAGYLVTPEAGTQVTCSFHNAMTVPSTTVPSTTVPSTTVPSTTVPSTTVPTSTTVACDDDKRTETTADDCPVEVIVGGVREARGIVVTDLDGGAAPGRLARTGADRTASLVGVAIGLLVMGGSLFLLGRSTTVTPKHVYVGNTKVRRRR